MSQLFIELGTATLTTYFIITNWICNDSVIKFKGLDYLDDEAEMNKTAAKFKTVGCHQGILGGVIGCLDGWIVKIRKPSRRDTIGDVSSFYCRKSFYGLNVQAMVDREKRIIWRSIRCRGSEHDYNAFKKSNFYRKLIDRTNHLSRLGCYVVGDSA